MKENTLEFVARRLAETFGREKVKVRSAHHIQVITNIGVHNIYVRKTGALRLLRAGCVRAKGFNRLDDILAVLHKHSTVKTDMDFAKEAVDLAQFIGMAKRLIPQDLDEAVYVDAGFKDGLAQVAVVHIERWDGGFATQAISYPIRLSDIVEAERRAVSDGLKLAGSAVVFSDCKKVVDEFAPSHGNQVRWISRDENRLADSLGNRRGKS